MEGERIVEENVNLPCFSLHSMSTQARNIIRKSFSPYKDVIKF
jgi:hypothetical protein